MVRLSRGRGSEAWQMMQPTWTDISQMSICLLPQVDKWHRQRLPSSQKHIRRPMVSAVIVGGRVVVRCSREDDGQQGSRPREEVACAGVLSHPSPGSTEHRHRLPSHRSWTSKEARENKSLGQPAKRPITRRCRARSHFQVSTGGGLSFAGPQFPPVAIARRQSRRKMRALHWSSCLSPPSKTNLLAIRAILPPERPRTNEAQPNRSPRQRIAVFPTRILCCHRICPAGELLSRRACVN